MVNQKLHLEKLVNQFADATAKQTDAIWQGDAKTGNRQAKRLLAAFDKLRSIGNSGRDALVPLLSHQRPDVRVRAAAFLLRHRTAEAMAVLTEIAKGRSLTAFGAQQALERWKEGTWKLDPPDEQ